MMDILWGAVIGGVVMTVLIFGGLGFAQWLDKSRREEEIQARLNRALKKIEQNDSLLQQEISLNSQITSEFAFAKHICATAIEQTLAYFEQTPAIFGDKNRDKIKQELHETLGHIGRNRKEPIALLEHILSNGGDHEQPAEH